MKVAFSFLACCWAASGEHARSNPLSAVLDLLSNLASKIEKDADSEAKAYREYVEWCDDTAKNTGFAITTCVREKEQLEARIGDLTGKIGASEMKIEELIGSISSAEADLKEASTIREKEHTDFLASEAELTDTLDTLSRAISVLEKEMAKNPGAFTQVNSADQSSVLKALSVVLEAASISNSDQSKLTALIQSQQSDDADELSSPAAAAYESHSTGIVDVLEDLKDKAEGQLSDLRKAEVNANHNYEMVKQSLEDQLSADNKDLKAEKTGKAGAEEGKATAQGDLSMTLKELSDGKERQATAHSTCMQVASDHAMTVESRAKELQVIAQAKKLLEESTAAAVSQTYSFVQLARTNARAGLAGMEVVAALKQLARKEHSTALSQLASRVSAVLRLSNGDDVFAKVKGLIQDMIAKLEEEAGADATEKAYCDEQMAKTEARKSELEDDLSRQTNKIERASAKSSQLQAEIRALESELSALAREQAEMDRIRQESHADFVAAKADLEQGLSGVRKALEVLSQYYGGATSMLQDDSKLGALMQQPTAPELHSKAGGAGGSIIDILQVVESDFATNLAGAETEEDDAQGDYDKLSHENAVTKTLKEQDVKYKTQEAKSLDKIAAQYSADKQSTGAEYAAVMEYYSQIKARCIAKPEAYSDRKAHREAEIAGLKQALSILEDETAFVQRKHHGHFRGSLAM